MSVVIDGTTGISGNNGSASTPAIQGEDTNTGVFFPAADTVAVATGGTERMRVSSAGQLGIAGANYGTSGQVLTSGGSGAAPSWATPAAPTTAQVGSATAGLAAGDVGTYAFMWRDNTSIAVGGTYAGSSLTYASMCDDSPTATASNTYRGSGLTRTSTTGSGTWLAMGAGDFGSSTYGQASLFLRIS